jgi:hypothetical protein
MYQAKGLCHTSPGQRPTAIELSKIGEAAPGLLAARLRVGALVFLGVRQAEGGAIDYFEPQTVPELSGLFSGQW